MKMDKKKRLASYQTPSGIKYTTTVLYIITSVCMAILPSYTCIHSTGGYRFGVSGALGELETDAGFTIWLLMYACMIAGLAFSVNDMIKIVPVVSSCYLTFATFYSTKVLDVTEEDLDLSYIMENSFYIVAIANVLLVAMTVIMLIKTKRIGKEKDGTEPNKTKIDEKSSQQ